MVQLSSRPTAPNCSAYWLLTDFKFKWLNAKPNVGGGGNLSSALGTTPSRSRTCACKMSEVLLRSRLTEYVRIIRRLVSHRKNVAAARFWLKYFASGSPGSSWETALTFVREPGPIPNSCMIERTALKACFAIATSGFATLPFASVVCVISFISANAHT